MPLIVHSICRAPPSHAGERIGDRQAQIVVAMDGEDRLVGVGHALAQHRGTWPRYSCGRGVADGVGDVDGASRPALDRGLDAAAQEIDARCGCRPRPTIRRRRRGCAPARPSAAMISSTSLRLHLQLVFHMQRRGGDEGVDARRAARGAPLRRSGRCPCARRGPGPQTEAFLTRRAISRTASKSPFEAIGKAGLDDVDAHRVENLGDLQLFLERHGGAGRLLAVAQGGVENDDAIGVVAIFRLARVLGAVLLMRLVLMLGHGQKFRFDGPRSRGGFAGGSCKLNSPKRLGQGPFVRSGAAKKQQEGVETRESVRREADLRIGRGVKARHARASSSRGLEGRVSGRSKITGGARGGKASFSAPPCAPRAAGAGIAWRRAAVANSRHSSALIRAHEDGSPSERPDALLHPHASLLRVGRFRRSRRLRSLRLAEGGGAPLPPFLLLAEPGSRRRAARLFGRLDARATGDGESAARQPGFSLLSLGRGPQEDQARLSLQRFSGSRRRRCCSWKCSKPATKRVSSSTPIPTAATTARRCARGCASPSIASTTSLPLR